MVQVLITNGGTHPADKWAEVSANEILAMIKIDDDSTSTAAAEARAAKRTLFPKLVDAIMAIHEATQQAEKLAMEHHGHGRLDKPHDVEQQMGDGVVEVVRLMAGTPFEAHFNTDDARAHVAKIIGQHSTDIMHIERSHFVSSQQGA